MKRYQPALLGGLLIGVLSSLPVVKIANCCCLWVIAGGILATYLLQQNKPEPVETGEAALSGLLAGFIGGLIVCVVTYVQFAVIGSMIPADALEQMRTQLDNPQVPEGVRNMILGIFTHGMVAITLIMLPVYAVFGMLGGLIGTAIFRKKTPPAGTPPVVQG